MRVLAVAVAFAMLAAAGAVARAFVGSRWNRHGGIPLGTLTVNVTGSLVLGLIHGVSPAVATVVGTGAIGAYTTFSSFAREVVALVEERRRLLAAIYVMASCALAIGAAWVGLRISLGSW